MGRRGEGAFEAVVGYEEEGGAWSGADDCGSDACVDAAKTASGEEARGGLKTSFKGVERVEGCVYCCACHCACLGMISLRYEGCNLVCKSLRRMTAKVDKRGRNHGQDMRVQSGSRMGIMAVARSSGTEGH